jgi:hypothetical protein
MRLSEYVAHLQKLAATLPGQDPYVFTPPDGHDNRHVVCGARIAVLHPMGGSKTTGPTMVGIELETRHGSYENDLAEQYYKLADAYQWRAS